VFFDDDVLQHFSPLALDLFMCDFVSEFGLTAHNSHIYIALERCVTGAVNVQSNNRVDAHKVKKVKKVKCTSILSQTAEWTLAVSRSTK
jgi:hypothetical protein